MSLSEGSHTYRRTTVCACFISAPSTLTYPRQVEVSSSHRGALWQSSSHPCHPISPAGPLSPRAFLQTAASAPQTDGKWYGSMGMHECRHEGILRKWELQKVSSVELGAMNCGEEGSDAIAWVLQERVMCGGRGDVSERQPESMQDMRKRKQIRSC